MNAPLPRNVERIVSFLIPAACREEVLGDLYESSSSTAQFLQLASRVIPMVVFSRMRRTADTQLLIIQAASLLMCFMGAAQLRSEASSLQGFGLLRLAIPISLMLLGSLLEGAYARPSGQSRSRAVAAPLLGLAFAYAAQWLTALCGPEFMLPAPVLLYGGAAGGLFCAALRISFPVTLEHGTRAMEPSFAGSRFSAPARAVSRALAALKLCAAIIMLAWIGSRAGGIAGVLVMAVIALAVIIFRGLTRTL